MIKLLLVIVLALFAAVGLAQWMQDDPGYLLITSGDITIEANLVVASILLIIGLIVFYIAMRVLIRLLFLPRDTRAALRRGGIRKAYRDVALGYQALTEGRWSTAEVALTRRADESEITALHYAAAAEAAHRQQVSWRRDDYLRKAENDTSKNAVTVGIIKAGILLDEDNPEEARRVLEPLNNSYRRIPRVMSLLAEAYRRLGDWEPLRDLLPAIGKAQALPPEDFLALQRDTYKALMAQAAQGNTPDKLNALWREVPLELRHDEVLLIEHAGHLRDVGAADRADTLIREAIQHQWNDQLVVAYGQLGRGNVASQLNVAEDWLKQQGKQPFLLLTLGRLARRNRQLGKARAYLEESLRMMPTPDAYQELGNTLEEMDERDAAYRCFRAGLRLVTGEAEDREASEILLSKGDGKALTPAGEEATLPAES